MPIHVESTNTRYGKIALAFKYEKEPVPGKNEEDLLKVYTMKPVSNAMLETIIGGNVSQSAMSNARRTPQEREAALQRSQQAQKLIARDIVTTAKTKYELEAAAGSISGIDRNTIYLRHEDTKEAADFNYEFLMACRNQEHHPEVLAQLQYKEIEEARKAAGIISPEQLSALFDASEQELLDRYPTINRYLRMLAETQALAQNKALTPQQREQLQKYQVGMNLMGVVEARMDLMANPVYPDVNPYALYGNSVAANDIADSMTHAGFPEADLGRDSALLHPLSSYFDSLKQCSEYYSSGILDRAAIVHPSLKNATFSTRYPDSDLMMGKAVVAHTKNGQDFVLTNRMPLKVQSAKEHTKELSELTIKADKWLLTGSRQFADMQKALKELDQAQQDQLPAEERAKKAARLVDAAKAYLEYKNVEFPYGAEQVMNHGKNQREQSRLDAAVSILSYATAQQTAVETSQKNEKLLKEVSVNINASRQQRFAFTHIMNDLIIADITGNDLHHPKGSPPSREEFAALVLLACGSQQVAGPNPEAKYASLVQSVLFEGASPTSQQTELIAKAKNMVKDAISSGKPYLLSQLVTEGLLQNNKLLQKQSAIDDRFCFLADLGGKAMQMPKKNSALLDPLPLYGPDRQAATAAKAISNLRAKGLECQRDMAYRFGQDIESPKQDAADLATVCQMYGVNKHFAGKQLDLASSPYGQVPDFAGKCSQQMAQSKAFEKFIDRDADEKFTAVQDPKAMANLHGNFTQEMVNAVQQQQQAAQRTLNVVQQPKEMAPKSFNL